MDKKYFIIGNDAAFAMCSEGFDELIAYIESDEICTYELFCFSNQEGELEELLEKVVQLGDFCILTEEQYNTLSDL